jgi:hypothetical protein
MTDIRASAPLPPAAPVRPRTDGRWLDLALLGVVALVFRLPAYVSPRHLTFDDGVFASSALAMRDGDVPFRDVFSSQGPLFLPLVRLGDLVGWQTTNSPRVLAVISGVVIVLALYWAARRMTDRLGALLAGALAATAGSLVWVTGPLAADGPALAFVAVAFALCLPYRDRPGAGRAIAIGLAVGAALSTKAIEFPVVVPVGLVLGAPFVVAVARRRLTIPVVLNPIAAGAAAMAVYVGLSLVIGWNDVWDQAVTYRSAAAADPEMLADAGKILSTLWDRDLVVLVFAAVAAVGGALAYRRTGRARPLDQGQSSWAAHHPPADPPGWVPSAPLLLTAWLVTTVTWLVVAVSPMSRPHLSAIILPLVLLVGVYRPPLKATAIAAVVLVPVLVIQLDGVRWPRDYTGSEADTVAILRQLPDDAWVLSDDPGLAWRSGHRTTADLVDTSRYRVAQDRITTDTIVAQAADPQVCAVVSRSFERFASFDDLGDRLVDEGYVLALDAGGPRMVWIRPDCEA